MSQYGTSQELRFSSDDKPFLLHSIVTFEGHDYVVTKAEGVLVYSYQHLRDLISDGVWFAKQS